MPAQNLVLIDLEALKSAKAVMNNKFARIIEYYYEDTQLYLDIIVQGFTKQDATMIMPAAHTIKSSSRQLGAFVLADAALALETAAKEVIKQNMTLQQLENKGSYYQDIFDSTKAQMQLAIQEMALK